MDKWSEVPKCRKRQKEEHESRVSLGRGGDRNARKKKMSKGIGDEGDK